MINLFEIIKTKMKYIDSKIPDVNLLINNYFQSIDVIYQRIETNIKKKILLKKNIFFQLSPKINQDAVKSYLDILKNKLTYTNKNLLKNTKIFVKERQIRFNLVIKQLNLVSYKETLRRGFAVVKKDRQIIRNNKETNLGDELEIEFFNDKSRVRKIR
jgi:exodeoxyribonuclease VII large subunit